MRVSIPLWIFCSLRQPMTMQYHFHGLVSIPLWIFCSLRRRIASWSCLVIVSFNSVVDFLFPATLRLTKNPALMVFQFRCGFSVPCDGMVEYVRERRQMFQFRCGFSVPCDALNDCRSTFSSGVSIPLWIFCSLRLFFPVVCVATCMGFNSVVDFLFPATR